MSHETKYGEKGEFKEYDEINEEGCSIFRWSCCGSEERFGSECVRRPHASKDIMFALRAEAAPSVRVGNVDVVVCKTVEVSVFPGTSYDLKLRIARSLLEMIHTYFSLEAVDLVDPANVPVGPEGVGGTGGPSESAGSSTVYSSKSKRSKSVASDPSSSKTIVTPPRVSSSSRTQRPPSSPSHRGPIVSRGRQMLSSFFGKGRGKTSDPVIPELTMQSEKSGADYSSLKPPVFPASPSHRVKYNLADSIAGRSQKELPSMDFQTLASDSAADAITVGRDGDGDVYEGGQEGVQSDRSFVRNRERSVVNGAAESSSVNGVAGNVGGTAVGGVVGRTVNRLSRTLRITPGGDGSLSVDNNSQLVAKNGTAVAAGSVAAGQMSSSNGNGSSTEALVPSARQEAVYFRYMRLGQIVIDVTTSGFPINVTSFQATVDSFNCKAEVMDWHSLILRLERHVKVSVVTHTAISAINTPFNKLSNMLFTGGTAAGPPPVNKTAGVNGLYRQPSLLLGSSFPAGENSNPTSGDEEGDDYDGSLSHQEASQAEDVNTARLLGIPPLQPQHSRLLSSDASRSFYSKYLFASRRKEHVRGGQSDGSHDAARDPVQLIPPQGNSIFRWRKNGTTSASPTGAAERDAEEEANIRRLLGRA